jgi:hypothetical protein
MAWTRPPEDRAAVNRAGRTVINYSAEPEEGSAAIDLINEWRTAHGRPLNSEYILLRDRARRVCGSYSVNVAQRLKRLPAIQHKLERFSAGGMKLTTMQDIGGCRAVLPTIEHVRALARIYSPQSKKNRCHAFKDYIDDRPKSDGYRSYHAISKYHSRSKAQAHWNNLKIEIQIRTELQHSWAAALETVDLFTGQRLKSDMGNPDWMRFFALMGNANAMAENCRLIDGTPDNPRELSRELSHLEAKLGAIESLRVWSHVAKNVYEYRSQNKAYFLISIDFDAKALDIQDFGKRDFTKATAAYKLAEEKAKGKTRSNTVLIGINSLAAARRAYPSYFADNRTFIQAVRTVVRSSWRSRKSGGLPR